MEKLNNTTLNNILIGGTVIYITGEITSILIGPFFPTRIEINQLGRVVKVGIALAAGYLTYKYIAKPLVIKPKEVEKKPEEKQYTH